MKKNTSLALLAFLLTLFLLPKSVTAASKPTDADLKTPPVISKLEIHNDGESNVWLEVTLQTPANVMNAVEYFENHESGYNQAGYIGGVEMQCSIDGGEWQIWGLASSPNYDHDDNWNGVFESEYLNELHISSSVKAQVRYTGADANGNGRVSNWSNMLTLNEKADFTAAEWAQPELAEAARLGLIPDSLMNADLTQPITRAEFAAVSVKVYESLTGQKAQPAAANPFGDTTDAEVLKACSLGVTNGTGTGTDGKLTFSPNVLLNRETLATMLTRVYKKVAIKGWTLDTDASYGEQFKAMFAMPALFADDAKISAWAKDSVYFMNANNIVNGIGGNNFAPKATTSAEQAANYAVATRQVALVMAVRMVKNLG